MKKLFALLILLFFVSTNSCFAFSELYYLKNIKTADVQPIVENSYSVNGFNIIKQSPYYGISQKGEDSAVIILQQSGENMFYYYQSENNSKVNKSVLKEIKKQNIVCEQSFNANIINIYDNLAKDVVSTVGAIRVYDFKEPASAFTPPAAENYEQKQKPNTFNGYVGQVPAGTVIKVYLQNAINTATAAKGDKVVAVLTDNLVYNGAVIAPQGSLVYGTLTKARNATYGSQNGRVVIGFTNLVTPDNVVYNISAEAIDFKVSNEGKVGSAVKSAATSAVAGAVVGILVALISGRTDNVWRSAAIGAGAGAGSSVIYSTAEKGVDAEIPSFTEMDLTLTQPFNVSVSY